MPGLGSPLECSGHLRVEQTLFLIKRSPVLKYQVTEIGRTVTEFNQYLTEYAAIVRLLSDASCHIQEVL